MDALISHFATISLAAASAILLDVPLDHRMEDAIELRLLLIPLIGALIASGGFIMLNPNPETRRIVIGRAMFAVFSGVAAPQVLSAVHPSLAALSSKPMPLLMAGGIIAGITYVLSKPFATGFYNRSERIAARELDRLEKVTVREENDNQPPNQP